MTACRPRWRTGQRQAQTPALAALLQGGAWPAVWGLRGGRGLGGATAHPLPTVPHGHSARGPCLRPPPRPPGPPAEATAPDTLTVSPGDTPAHVPSAVWPARREHVLVPVARHRPAHAPSRPRPVGERGGARQVSPCEPLATGRLRTPPRPRRAATPAPARRGHRQAPREKASSTLCFPSQSAVNFPGKLQATAERNAAVGSATRPQATCGVQTRGALSRGTNSVYQD